MKTVAAAILGISLTAFAGEELPTFKVFGQQATDIGPSPACFLLECNHVWQYKIGELVVAERECEPGYVGWAYLNIFVVGQAWEIHCCPEFMVASVTYLFLPDNVTIIGTSVDCVWVVF
jgi:hypothetical protein